MATINTYLSFMGNTEEAFNFYKSVFGGEFVGGIRRYEDMPDNDALSKEDKKKVMHVGLPIGSGNVLMGTDILKSRGQSITFGNNFYISISPESREEATQLFNGLSSGGTITSPLEDTFWGAYFGAFTDKFGVQWMVNYLKQ
ncbi:VOC family protein [Aquimarina litoralis]|uniref:VOC family protein n=1 Tax=Aquimarina litoralis TaxID=584605 RepID=UPI001C5A206C|nr:VOC family protein [Aquimarina litoralis]MBW1297910.1 VOC family protein [Aquimarina litoralis]